MRLRRGLPDAFPHEHRLQIARGMWVGLAYLHSLQIVHRDIKPANILIRLGLNAYAVLADMGLATKQIISTPSIFAGGGTEEKHTAKVCSDRYIAPELLLARGRDTASYDSAVDVWSAAVVSFEIASLLQFIESNSVDQQLGQLACRLGRASSCYPTNDKPDPVSYTHLTLPTKA